MASPEDLVAQRNKLQSEILALERTLGEDSSIVDLISSGSGSDGESDDSGHAGEEVDHQNLEAEREQIQREISELEVMLGADAALVDALTDSEHGTDSPVDSSDDDDDELDLPQDLDTCLQLNLVYQEVLKEKLAELERLLNENREQQKEIEAQLSGPSSNFPGLPHLKLFLGSFMKPYFKDKLTGLGPPANEETKEKMSQGTKPCDGMKIRRWEPWQKTLLIKSVVTDTMKRMLQPKMSKMEYLTAKMTKVTDEEKEGLKKQIAILEKEIKEISSMKEEELYGKRYDDHDWDKISNIDFEGLRQPDDLMRFWQNYLHPSINKSTWKQDEIEKLAAVAEQYNHSHWDQIAEALGTNRSAFMCFQTYQRYISKTFKKREWTKEEDQVLRDLVEKMRIGNFIPYTQMSYFMEGRDYSQLIYRWTTVLDPSIKKGPWTKEEDQLLLNAVKKNGCKEWWKIKNEVPGRTDNACRDRYVDCLREGVKRGTWSPEEVELLKKMVAKYGVGKWSKIAAEIPNRIDSQCLNKWKSMNKSAAKRVANTTCAPEPKRRNVAHAKIKEEEIFCDSSSDDEKTAKLPSIDSDSEEANIPLDNLQTRQEYIQPDMKDWIPVRPKTLVNSNGHVKHMLVRLANKEKDEACKERTEKHLDVCRNTLVNSLGYPVRSFISKDFPTLKKWNISDESAMIMVPADEVKSFLSWKRRSALKGQRSKAAAAFKLNFSLFLAVTPWVGNVLVPILGSERDVSEADVVRRTAAKIPLTKTPVFMFFLLALHVDAEGCKKVILARKSKPSSAPRTDQNPKRAKTLAAMLAEAKKPKECPLQLLESVNLASAPQPTTIPLPAIYSQQQSKPPQDLQPPGQTMKPSLIVPKTFIITQPNMPGVIPLNPVVQRIVCHPQPGAQVTSLVPQSSQQLEVPVEPGKSAQQSAATSSSSANGPAECSTETGTSKRRRKPTAKAQALLESAKRKTSKKEPAKNILISQGVATDLVEPPTAWILTPAGLMPVAAIQVTYPPAGSSPGQNSSPSVVTIGCNVSLPPSSNSNTPRVASGAGKSIPGVPVVPANTNVLALQTESSVKVSNPNTACDPNESVNIAPQLAFKPPAIVNDTGSFVLLCNSVKPLTLNPFTVPVVNKAAAPSLPVSASPTPNLNVPGVQSIPAASVFSKDLPKSAPEVQSSLKSTPNVTPHVPTVQVGVRHTTPSSSVVPSVMTQQAVPRAETQTVQTSVMTDNPNPNPDALSFDANLVFSEPPGQVKHWMKGNGGITVIHQQNKMPYLPPFVSNINTLVSLLKAKESFLKSAERLLPDEARKNEEQARVASIRKLVSERFQNNPAYLLLKARFLSCFTLPALLATINPNKDTKQGADRDEEDGESRGMQKQGGVNQPQKLVPQLSTNENEVSAAQYSGLRPRKKRDSHVHKGTPAAS